MRCYICDSETEYIDKKDGKPICDDCQEVIAEVIQEWYEDGIVEGGDGEENSSP